MASTMDQKRQVTSYVGPTAPISPKLNSEQPPAPGVAAASGVRVEVPLLPAASYSSWDLPPARFVLDYKFQAGFVAGKDRGFLPHLGLVGFTAGVALGPTVLVTSGVSTGLMWATKGASYSDAGLTTWTDAFVDIEVLKATFDLGGAGPSIGFNMVYSPMDAQNGVSRYAWSPTVVFGCTIGVERRPAY